MSSTISTSPPPPTDEWVGMPYVCQTYKVGETVVHNAIKNGDLVAYRIGAKHLRFRLSDVRAWAKPVNAPAGGDRA